jgi:hypothetical protein
MESSSENHLVGCSLFEHFDSVLPFFENVA